jgi:hypothetical protein
MTWSIKASQLSPEQTVENVFVVSKDFLYSPEWKALRLEAIKKYGAELTAKGLSEAQVSALASQGYQQIAATLAPETKLSGIYEGQNAADAASIQAQLEAEQFRGLESERRKRLAEQEQMAFKGQSGTISANRLSGGSLSTSSTIGGI